MEEDDALKIKEVSLSSSNLQNSIKFWNGLLEMQIISQDEKQVILNYDPKQQTNLRLVETKDNASVDHATAFGRIAFSIPTQDLPPLESKISKADGLGKVKTSRVVLDTPGKADVEVIILEDPVGFDFNTPTHAN